MPTSIDKRRAPYSGKLRRLVVAMDVGTTFSGAAWAVLDPGRVPEIKSVRLMIRNEGILLIDKTSVNLDDGLAKPGPHLPFSTLHRC
jgi:hypothetical protein